MADALPNNKDSLAADAAKPASAAPAGAPARVSAPDPKPRRGAGVVAILALLLGLLAVTAVAALGWWTWQGQQRAPAAVAAPAPSVAPEALERVVVAVQGLEESQATLTLAQRDLGRELEQAQAAVAAVGGKVDVLSSADRSDWKLAEIEYLLRLANQRLLTGGDSTGALALLQSADAIARELGYADLFPLRSQLASEIAALRATGKVDVEGVYLQLAALGGEVERLVFWGPPELRAADVEAAPSEAVESALAAGWREVLATLRELVRVTPREVEVRPQLSVDQRLYLRARIELQLEQAKNALLLRQPVIYGESLRQARQLIADYFDAGDTATAAALATCDQLLAVEIDAELPDISQSQVMIRDYIEARIARGNAP